MDWFGNRDKSITKNAQQVVKDMHSHLDQAKKRNRELSKIIIKFQGLCVDSLENELKRLEIKKSDLHSELERIDREILEKRVILDNTRQEVRNILDSSNIIQDEINTMKSYDSNDGENIRNSKKQSQDTISRTSSNLEQQYMEETEMLETCREVVTNFLFLIHKNDSINDVIAYSLASKHKNTEKFIECCKVVNLMVNPTTTSLSNSELYYEGLNNILYIEVLVLYSKLCKCYFR